MNNENTKIADFSIFLNLSYSDLTSAITYLKDYSLLIGKSFHQTTDKNIQKQLSDVNFDINRIIIKLEKELKNYEMSRKV